jgi:transcription factor IIIB subunit 2
MKNVAACCIYLADRKQAESTLLLMDLAEKCSVSVWVLGDTYKQFLACLMETDPGKLDGMHKIPQLEPLVLKFCRKLEFGIDSHRVAEDAVNLLKRMKRDWMVEGRQPAGVIGAAIVLAARMNNFRRTVREVVYTVKVADSTINQRLYEFKRTKSSNLTLSQWREYGLRLKDDVLPPAIYRRQEKEEKKKRKLAALAAADGDASADAEVVATNPAKRPRAKVTKKRKTTTGAVEPTASDNGTDQNARDENGNGFLIPDIPLDPQAQPQDTMNFESESHLEYVAAAAAPEELIDAADEEPLPVPKKRGRPPKKRQPVVIADEDLEIEAEIETEMRDNLRAWENIFLEFRNNEEHPVLVAAGDKAEALAREHMTSNVPETEIVEEDEFEDDDDVANCLNSPAEVAIKEKVWITQNEEWLRHQQTKMLEKELQEASGKTKKPKRRRKRYQMGDGSVLDGQPAGSAAEAVSKMIQKRAKFSSHIDYEKLQELFNTGTGEGESAATSANGASPAEAGASAQGTQNKPAAEVQEIADEDEGDYEEEEEEVEEVYDEPDDDPNMYMSDEEYGFEDIPDDF